MAAMSCDARSIEDFVKQGHTWAKHHGRKVQALTYIQSFAANELSADNPDDVNYCNELGAELARRMHPNSPALTITHTDGEGGKVHNHIVVLNHDMQTGYALKDYKLHHQVARVNDELMVGHGFTPVVEKTVAERGSKGAESTKHVAKARGFDAQLLEAVRGARGASESFSMFVDECKARGVDVDVREDKGITYRMMDETAPKRRVRRRKASKLGRGFTKDELEKAFEAKTKTVKEPEVPDFLEDIFEEVDIEGSVAALRERMNVIAREVELEQKTWKPEPKPEQAVEVPQKPVEPEPEPKPEPVEVVEAVEPVAVTEASVEPVEPVQPVKVPEHEEKSVEKPKKPVRRAPAPKRKAPVRKAPQKRRPGSAPQKQVDEDDYGYW